MFSDIVLVNGHPEQLLPLAEIHPSLKLASGQFLKLETQFNAASFLHLKIFDLYNFKNFSNTTMQYLTNTQNSIKSCPYYSCSCLWNSGGLWAIAQEPIAWVAPLVGTSNEGSWSVLMIHCSSRNINLSRSVAFSQEIMEVYTSYNNSLLSAFPIFFLCKLICINNCECRVDPCEAKLVKPLR